MHAVAPTLCFRVKLNPHWGALVDDWGALSGLTALTVLSVELCCRRECAAIAGAGSHALTGGADL